MLKRTNNIILLFTLSLLLSFINVTAQEAPTLSVAETNTEETTDINVKEMIMSHIGDSYEWHFMKWKDKDISIPLPIILHSKESGWNIFLSSELHNPNSKFNQFYIAQEGKHAGKIVEKDSSGAEIAPFDISLTKNATSLVLTSILLIVIVMSVAQFYKRRDSMSTSKGLVGLIEIVVTFIVDEVAKPSIGKEYQRFTPFLLTIFFFILLNNLMGLIPIFPGGANVTGNIAVTLVLALTTFLVVNLTGSKAYYKDIFWPDVPTWLKAPAPIMPLIEIIGTITKPFALMIRLFANITAGHSIVLGLTSVIFVTAKLGAATNGAMTMVAILFGIFIGFLEILVAFIQAYIFTLLSAVFIGLARTPEGETKESVQTIE